MPQKMQYERHGDHHVMFQPGKGGSYSVFKKWQPPAYKSLGNVERKAKVIMGDQNPQIVANASVPTRKKSKVIDAKTRQQRDTLNKTLIAAKRG